METNTKLPDYSGISEGTWLIDGKYIVATTEPETYPRKYNDGMMIALMLSDEDDAEVNIPDKLKQLANAQAIANLPNLIQENEKLKAQCETYAKDYNEMVKEVLRLSRENSKMKEMIGERIKELEQ